MCIRTCSIIINNMNWWCVCMDCLERGSTQVELGVKEGIKAGVVHLYITKFNRCSAIQMSNVEDSDLRIET